MHLLNERAPQFQRKTLNSLPINQTNSNLRFATSQRSLLSKTLKPPSLTSRLLFETANRVTLKTINIELHNYDKKLVLIE